MKKAYILIAYDGTEVIDNTPDAERRVMALDSLEKQWKMEMQERKKKVRTRQRQSLWKLASFCGIV